MTDQKTTGSPADDERDSPDPRDSDEPREDDVKAAQADQGSAPQSGAQIDADPAGEVDQVALDIAQSASNDEPPP